jgi:DNA-binding MarR family transcriptional regulator
VGPEVRETAVRLAALMRCIFISDSGQHLRVIEESGLTLTQTKVLLLLAAPSEGESQPTGTEIAESLGVSPATLSRAVDGLARKRLVRRIEDRGDRRVRRIAATEKGTEFAGTLIQARLAGLEDFAATLSAAERRRLDAAVGALLSREDVAAAYEQLKEVRAS